MNPGADSVLALFANFPRASGDEPRVDMPFAEFPKFSPREWG